MTDGSDKSAALRARLATVGINLDQVRAKAQELPRAHAEPVAINRNAIRAILRGRGAPEHALEWLTQSCPSKAAALAYRPPNLAPLAPAEPEESTPETETSDSHGID